jgi:hypothetical protein
VAYIVAYRIPGRDVRVLYYLQNQLSALSVTTYDFRTAMKRVGASIRR